MSEYFTGKAALDNYAKENIAEGAEKSFANRTFSPWDNNVSVRSDYNRSDYEYFRPSERSSADPIKVIHLAQKAYDEVGPVHNVIDTMSDFGSQGIRIQSNDKRQHEFYTIWGEKVNIKERSERFLSIFFRQANVIIQKAYADISVPMEKNWKKGVGQNNIKVYEPDPKPREIPLRYSFIPITAVEAINGENSVMASDKPNLGLKVTGIKGLLQALPKMDKKNPLYAVYNAVNERLPLELKKEILNGNSDRIPLNMNNIEMFYYKKDDWQLWARPMIACILRDIGMLEKMKQADVAALDGAISNIRLWKLGVITNDAQTTILPTKAQINLLRDILAKNVGGGVIDLVWGPDLDFKESNSQVWRFLGSEKYSATMNSIYEGLGIPSSLRGAGGSTNTGNFVGLKTLIKRLEYGRDALTRFWQKELNYIHKAMGFEGPPPVIMYDYMLLADEAAEKQLLINLYDRDIISNETIQEIFGRMPHIEQDRVNREFKERGKGMPDKASPFHNAEKEHDFNKALLGGGQVAPSEIGVNLKPRKPGEKTGLELQEQTQLKVGEQKAKQLAAKNAGRPKNKVETKKRKPKPKEKPSAKADVRVLLWSTEAQAKIHELTHSPLLQILNKTNARQLTTEEADNVEYTKFSILSNIKPHTEISIETIAKYVDMLPNPDMFSIADDLLKDFKNTNNRDPRVDELRQIYASSYAIFHTSNDTN